MVHSFPKISVITVCLNAEKIIERTIESVLKQTYSNVEYIIIDGGSLDGTVEILNSYKDEINFFASEKDNGIYHAMNKGIARATGDLVIFLNAGDFYISPNVLTYTTSKMNYSGADLFFARIIWEDITAKEIVLSDHSLAHFDWDLKHSNFPHPATFYKRVLFDKIGTFDETYKILADYEWNAKALVKYRLPFQYIDIIVAFFSTDGISNNASSVTTMQMEAKRIVDRFFQPSWMFNFIKNFNSDLLKKVIAKFFFKRLNRVY